MTVGPCALAPRFQNAQLLPGGPVPPWLRPHSMPSSPMFCSFWNIPGPGCPVSLPCAWLSPSVIILVVSLSLSGSCLCTGGPECSLDLPVQKVTQLPRDIVSWALCLQPVPPNSPVPKPAPRARLDPECSGPEITRPLRSLAWTAGRTSPCVSASHEGSGQGYRHPCAELALPGAAGDTGRESALPGSEALKT